MVAFVREDRPGLPCQARPVEHFVPMTESLFLRGLRSLQVGRFAEAVAAFREVLSQQPDLVEAHYNLGNAYIAQQDYQQALAAYGEAIRLKPDFVQAHTNQGFTYGKLRQHEQEMAAYREAVRIQPDFVEAYTQMGRAYLEQEKFELAIEPLRRGGPLRPAAGRSLESSRTHLPAVCCLF